MKRRPHGYYTVLVAGALARLRHKGSTHPTSTDVVRLLREMELLDPGDQNGTAAVRTSFNGIVIQRVDEALAGIVWKRERSL